MSTSARETQLHMAAMHARLAENPLSTREQDILRWEHLIAAAPETAAERDRLREEVARLGRERDELRQAWAQDPQLVTWQTERDRLQAENAALVAALQDALATLQVSYGRSEAATTERLRCIERARAALAAHAARTEGGTP